jgi:hypothetical protein
MTEENKELNEETTALTETHSPAGDLALSEENKTGFEQPEAKPGTEENKPEAKAPVLPEGFSEEKWQELSGLEKKFLSLREKYGISDLEELEDILEGEEGEEEGTAPAAARPAPAADEFLASMKPGEQQWIANFKNHLAKDPEFMKEYRKATNAHISNALFDNWMLGLQVENLTQALSGLKEFKVPKLEFSRREIRKVLDTFGKTMVPRALKLGKLPTSEAYAYLMAQRTAQKPAVETKQPSGIDRGLRTERPGGVPPQPDKPPFPMLPDGSDFDWEKMDDKQSAQAMAWLASKKPFAKSA